jgi:outer membrane lipoprotein-sorting protein
MIHRLQPTCQTLSGRAFSSFSHVLKCLSIAILFVLCLDSHVRGDCPGVDGFLHDFEKHRGNVETYSANFVQQRTLGLFGESRISTGEVFYKTPEKMMWKYQNPDKTQMLVKRESVSFYFPELEQIEIYAVGQGGEASSFFFAFEAGADELKKTFEISLGVDDEKLKRIELSPKSGSAMSQLASLILWIDKSDYLPREILIRDQMGDTTKITLSDIKVNEPIPDDKMKFNAPEGTAIVEGDSGAFSF